MAPLDYKYIAQIVSRAQQGDSDAFAELYAATFQRQYHFAYRYLKDEYLAQDALQETYVLALTHLSKLNNPSLVISWLNQTQAGEHENPTYNLEVTSKMLVRSVVASVDGSNVPVYETDAHVYSIEPAKNGKMAVTVTLMNNQTATQYVDVENVDFDIPVLVSNNIDAENVYLFLSDAGSGIDYDNIRALTLDGREVSPASVDTELGRVTFTRTNDSMNIYIPDFKGNELHLVLTIQ